MNPEILAPVGSVEALQAAFAAGADAVYFGLPQFGARAFANRFTLEQTKEIIEQAHTYGMKIYITMNTILYENEIEDAYEAAKALFYMNVDALIIQDLGLIHLLHERLPELELHASTQLSVSTPAQIEQLRKLGVSRVVLARECTLEQIRACAATGMEIEVFVHGALCISYSGQCQFSNVMYNRSGNRGMCA
ncbi:MAG TPA: peptidase U32, partial [Erysipelotrichaceae bacterium]|nr:peptidase U32 [Erysipelotrichaceae bacterium]